MISWFVVHTQPSRESVAVAHLQEQGFEVYLPRFKKIRRHARKVDEVLYPLFPRYLFVGMDPETARWRSINGTRGVSYLLTNESDRPAQIPSSVIEALKAQENAEGLVDAGSLASFMKGDTVLITDGVLKDQTAIFDALDDKGRVRLLLSLLGRDVTITLPTYAVDVAA